MPTPIDLSILVCGVHTRRSTFLPKIQDQLFGQFEALPPDDQQRVEIVVLVDNKAMMLGDKRNVMVDLAQGRYVVFVDDDDRVADDYVSALLEATASDADVIVFQAMVSLNGEAPKVCNYSRTYHRDHNTADGYFRLPNHICCVKRELGRKVSFPSILYGEDAAYSKLLKRHLRTEHRIERPLYYYDYDASSTETQERRVTPARRRLDAPPVVDVVILSKAATSTLRKMTQHAVDSCIAGANGLAVNVVVVEQQPGVTYADASTVTRTDRFHYNRFANDTIRAGAAPWVMVANNDLEFTDGWLHQLLAAEHPVVSPRSPADHRQADNIENVTGYDNGRHFSGWCFMMERPLWERLGGLDESVTFWCSDDVVLEQLKVAEVEAMLVADAVVHHLTSKTLATVKGSTRAEMTWGQVAAFNEQHGTDKFAGNPGLVAWQRSGRVAQAPTPPPPPEPAETRFAVIAYETRIDRAKRLADFLGAEIYVDDPALGLGPAGNHLRALKAASGRSGHLVVVEDDAELHPDFVRLVNEWIGRHPDDLISYYLGSGKPANWQHRINIALTGAERARKDKVRFKKLFHGVAYSVPCHRLDALLTRLDGLNRGIDLALGDTWFKMTARSIVYTLPSLTDHADADSTHARPQSARRAWRPPERTIDW